MEPNVIITVLSVLIPSIIVNVVAIIVQAMKNKNDLEKIALQGVNVSKQTTEEVQKNHAKAMEELIARSDKTITIIETKLDALTKQVEKHNSVIDRMFAAEADIKLLKAEDDRHNARLKVIEDRLNEKEHE